MNLKTLFTGVLLIFGITAKCQEPFSSLFIEKRYKILDETVITRSPETAKELNVLKSFRLSSVDPEKNTKSKRKKAGGNSDLIDYSDPSMVAKTDTLLNSDLFGSSALGIDIGSDVSIPRVKVGLIHYKLGIWTGEGDDTQVNADGSIKVDKKASRLVLPLFLFSRLSTENDSSNATSSIDALDYDGSPVTARLMPSFGFDIGEENNLYIGAIFDYRGLNVVMEDGNNSYEHGFYSAIGFRYSGKGTAQTNSLNQVIPGKWSLTCMLSRFSGSETVMRELFQFEDNTEPVTGFQAILSFKVAEKENQSVNFRASYSRTFDDYANIDPSLFKLSLGVN